MNFDSRKYLNDLINIIDRQVIIWNIFQTFGNLFWDYLDYFLWIYSESLVSFWPIPDHI